MISIRNSEKWCEKMKNKKLWIFIGILLIVIVLNRVFGWSSYLGDMDNLEFLERIVEQNLAMAAIIYIVLTIVGCVVLALPGITFAVIAGVLFGPVWGTVFCSAATTIGAILAFFMGRFFLKDSIRPLAMKNRYLKKWLFDESGKNEIFVLMITRLVPVFPYNLQNFAYGVTDIDAGTYALFSMLFMLPGTAMYTIGAAGLADSENRVLYIGIALFMAAAVIGIGFYLKKHYIKEGKTENDGTEKEA